MNEKKNCWLIEFEGPVVRFGGPFTYDEVRSLGDGGGRREMCRLDGIANGLRITKCDYEHGLKSGKITKIMTYTELRAAIDEEFLVETNEGTYGGAEAISKIGCADPHFADRRVYETADGRRRETGPDAEEAPGYMRRINKREMAEKKIRVQAMKKELREIEKYKW